MFQEKINFEEAKNKAVEFIKRNGPSLPSQVAKEVGIPPLFASALLSQLIAEKSVKVSELKVGGSPLYYQESQKELLLNFTTFMPGVEKETCEKLKKAGVLADDGLQLQEKVALRNIRDFSVPLNVKIGGEGKIFWRWYSLTQEEASKLVENFLRSLPAPPAPVRQQEEKPLQEERREVREIQPEIKVEEEKELAPGEKERDIKVEERVVEKPRAEEDVGAGGVTVQEGEKQEQESKVQARKSKEQRKPREIDFLQEVQEFLAKNEVKIIEEVIVRKSSEIEFVLQLSSSLGKMNFFAIAKNKRILTPADLMLAYYRSQEKKLPLILLNSGKFAKNTEEKAGELGITLKSLQEK